ncbi:MAG TPA: NUDIX domain-containing protein [Moraxellaceae bacterium]|nr:NUDIX domain-containing protein [Moraxellaceae bacterium]
MTTQYRTEADFLKAYNIHDYDIPLVSVDIAIFTLHDDQLKVLLVKRPDYPQKGKWALPGGFVDVKRDNDLRETALRKLSEKTSVHAPYLEQLESVGSATRDPRGWSVTVVYFALIPYHELAPAKTVSEEVGWVSVEQALERKLAFDHTDLLQRSLNRVRSKVLYTLMPAYLIASPFTLSTLQQAYEIILGRPVEKKAFRRRLENAEVIEPTGGMESQSAGRPAALYRLKPAVSGFNFSRQLNP